jgi:hypothetical protein
MQSMGVGSFLARIPILKPQLNRKHSNANA